MDPVSVISVLSSVLAAVIDITRVFNVSDASRIPTRETFDAARTQRSAQRRALVDNYGPAVGLPVYFFLGNTATQYLRIQRSVLNGKDQDAVEFRQAVTYECNMTAIAVRTPSDF